MSITSRLAEKAIIQDAYKAQLTDNSGSNVCSTALKAGGLLLFIGEIDSWTADVTWNGVLLFLVRLFVSVVSDLYFCK